MLPIIEYTNHEGDCPHTHTQGSRVTLTEAWSSGGSTCPSHLYLQPWVPGLQSAAVAAVVVAAAGKLAATALMLAAVQAVVMQTALARVVCASRFELVHL